MRVYELKPGTVVTIRDLPDVPPLKFERMDGMYARLFTEDGQLVWLGLGAEVDPIQQGEKNGGTQ